MMTLTRKVQRFCNILGQLTIFPRSNLKEINIFPAVYTINEETKTITINPEMFINKDPSQIIGFRHLALPGIVFFGSKNEEQADVCYMDLKAITGNESAEVDSSSMSDRTVTYSFNQGGMQGFCLPPVPIPSSYHSPFLF